MKRTVESFYLVPTKDEHMVYRKITEEELTEILDKHAKWRRGEKGGERADLSEADLSWVNLSRADLSEANLSRANLSEANLYEADLSWVNLSGANFFRANLFEANLSEAYNIDKAKNLFCPIACPDTGAFIAWKKAYYKNRKECIVKLRVCDDAFRSSATSRKCRCSKAEVLEIQTPTGKKLDGNAFSCHDNSFCYIPGQNAEVSDFDQNRWNECSTGIHFYITREEAVRHQL